MWLKVKLIIIINERIGYYLLECSLFASYKKEPTPKNTIQKGLFEKNLQRLIKKNIYTVQYDYRIMRASVTDSRNIQTRPTICRKSSYIFIYQIIERFYVKQVDKQEFQSTY